MSLSINEAFLTKCRLTSVHLSFAKLAILLVDLVIFFSKENPVTNALISWLNCSQYCATSVRFSPFSDYSVDLLCCTIGRTCDVCTRTVLFSWFVTEIKGVQCVRGAKKKCNLLLLFLSLKVVTKLKIMEQPWSLFYVHGHFVKGVADIKSANLTMMS